MALQTSITIVDPYSGEKRQVAGNFPAAEETTVYEYVRAAEALIQTQYFKEKQQASLHISAAKHKDIEVRAYLPPTAVCDAMIFRLRPFVLAKERTYFPKVCGLVGKHLDDISVHLLLRAQRDIWEGKHFRAMLQVSDHLGILNSDNAIMDYLNAHEYHRDKDKQDRLASPRHFMGDVGLRAFYLLLLTEKAKAIMNIAHVCEVILGTRRELTVNFRGAKPKAS